MKPQTILSTLAIITLPLATISCGGKSDSESGESGSSTESSSATAKTHEEIGKGMVEVMTEMMTNISTVKDVASAEAFAAKAPELKTKMKGLLESAKSLAAPTEEEKAAVTKMMDDAQEAAGPKMMETMMGMKDNPDAEAIGKIIQGVMQDKEMDQVGDELQAMYEVDESGENEDTKDSNPE